MDLYIGKKYVKHDHIRHYKTPIYIYINSELFNVGDVGSIFVQSPRTCKWKEFIIVNDSGNWFDKETTQIKSSICSKEHWDAEYWRSQYVGI